MSWLGSRSPRANALGSLLRTSSGFFLAIVLPPVLVRDLGAGRYASWALAAEYSGYTALLEIGASLAAASLVAAHPTSGPQEIGKALRRISLMLAAGAAIFTLGTSIFLAHLVAGSSTSMQLTQQLVILLSLPSVLYVGTSYALGTMIGSGALLKAGSVIFAGRATATILVLIGVLRHSSPFVLAGSWAAAASVGFLLLVPLARRERSEGLVAPAFRRQLQRTAWAFSGGFAVWAAAGFLVVGLDTTIVAGSDLRYVSAYAIAASFPLLLQAGLSALLAPTLPRIRRKVAGGQAKAAEREVLGLVRLAAVLVLFACALIGSDARRIMAIFAGTTDPKAASILAILAAAAAVRLIWLPASTAVLAVGEHIRNWWAPLCEGIANVGISLILAPWLGAVGVAIGTLGGSIIGVTVTVTLLANRIRSLRIPRAVDVRDLLTVVAVGTTIILAANSLTRRGGLSGFTELGVVVGCSVLALGLTAPGALKHHNVRFGRHPLRNGS